PGFATITASAGESGELSGTTVVGVCPRLAVGQVITTTMPYGAELCISGGIGDVAEYTYAPVHTGDSPTNLTITANGITAVTGPPTPQMTPARGAALNLTFDDLLAAAPVSKRQSISGARLSPRLTGSQSLSPGQPSRLIVPGLPSVDDEWDLNVAIGCSGPT